MGQFYFLPPRSGMEDQCSENLARIRKSMRTGILHSILGKRFGLICAFLGLIETGYSQFIAYNDHVPGPGTGPNVTTWSINTNNIGASPPPPPLPLKDVTSGATLGVTVQFATNRVVFAG